MQAKIRKKEKDAQYHSESLKYWNREVSALRGKERIARGLSTAKSDTWVKALHALGRGRKQNEQYAIAKSKLAEGQWFDVKSGESRARGAGQAKYREILAKEAAIQNSIDTNFGRNMDARMTKIYKHRNRALARNKEALGIKPEYGSPVMMPPRGDTSMANLSMMLSIASTGFQIASLFPASDIRLKENIKEIGLSPDGYKVYEFNYKANKNTRYRGAMAQDVLKHNPMAVGIRGNYLTVDYSKIDVNMEVIS